MHLKRVTKTDYCIEMYCSEFLKKSYPLLVESILTQRKVFDMTFAGNVYHFTCLELANIVHFFHRVLKNDVPKYCITLFFTSEHEYISFTLREVKNVR